MKNFLCVLLLVLLCFSLHAAESSDPSLSQWQALSDAQKALDSGSSDIKIIASLGSLPAPLDFWRNVLEARLQFADAKRVAELLQTLPTEPDPSENTTQNFYRDLYKQALTLKKDAVKLWALFPDEKNPQAQTIPAGATLTDKITRLHSLYEAKAYEGVRGLLSAGEIDAADLPQEKKCRAWFELGNSARQFQDKALAVAAYGRGGQKVCGSWAPKCLYWKGKIQAGLNQDEAAIETFRTLYRDFPSGNYADDALDSIRKIYKDDRNGKEAAARAELLKHGSGDMRYALLWEEAFDLYQAAFKEKNPDEKLKKCVSLLDEALTGGNPGDESRPQALYWKARALERMKKGGGAAAAKSAYQRVIQEFPLSYYSVLAGARLGTMPPPVSFGAPSGYSSGLVAALAAKGLYGEAQKAADLITSTQPMSVDEKIRIWTTAHGYYEALDLAGDKLGTGIRGPLDHASDPLMGVLYPVAYKSDLEKAARTSGLPRGAILGISREESLFRPKIRSHAGATGLMQLMPATARMQAGHMGVAGNIEDPAYNYLVGAGFFKKMVNQYDSIPLAIMAYNAGPGNVNKWLRSNGHLPLDEFVEEIPFSETRNYVKRVMRSMRIYGSLLHEGQFLKPFFKMTLR